jgi:L-lactate dehydrogenase complex protein LldG
MSPISEYIGKTNLKESTMISIDTELNKFIEKSEAVQTKCTVLKKDDLKTILKDGNFDYIKLNTPFKTYSKDCEFTESGVSKSIVNADFAIAETGTLVINSEDEHLRLATMLSESLSVVVYKSNIVSKLENIISFMNEINSKENAYIAFITGPSRTADIERVLTIGVHGPVELICYIIEDL